MDKEKTKSAEKKTATKKPAAKASTDLNCKVLGLDGKEVGNFALSPDIFGAKVRQGIVQATVRWQRACARQGTHSTLNKGEIEGGNRKPWRQKGTGRARAGSNTSPLWRGGSVAHGPHPRDYSFRLNKRFRREALTSVLTDKVNNGKLVILDSLNTKGTTKEMKKILGKIGVGEFKTLIVLPEHNEMVWRSSANLGLVTTQEVGGVNVYDLLNAEYLVSTKDGITALQARLEKSVA
jgi:large subunit ribosomal protein L4